MAGRFFDLVRREITFLFVSAILTVLAFLILAIWRQFDSTTFSFQQILLTSFVLGIGIYIFTFFSRSKLSKILMGKEMAAVLLIFTVLSFLILNVDRSRSVYLLKWIEMSSSDGISSEELSQRLGFSKVERADIEQRIKEQISSHTLTRANDKIKLTSTGRFLTKFFDVLAKFENLKGYPTS